MATYAGEQGLAPDVPKQYVEDLLNEIAADQAVFRITLQSLLLRLFATRPETAARGVAELRDQVLRSIDRIPAADADRAGGDRWKRLTAQRAEQLFGEIEDAMTGAPTSRQAEQ